MHVPRLRWVRSAVSLMLVAGLVLVVAACGSDDDSASTSTPASTGGDATAAAAPSGDPIVIGSIASCSGPLASGLGGACLSINAWAEAVNANGGINGHPVKLIVEDDGAVPERSVAAVKKLVEQDKVMAIVGDWSVADVAWQDYIEGKGVPVLGGGSSQVPFATSPNFFPSGAQLPPFGYAFSKLSQDAGNSKFGALYCAEAPICKQQIPLAEKANDLYGLGQEFVFDASISAAQPKYTAACLAAKEEGVETSILASGGDIVALVARQCAQQGFEPLWLLADGALNAVNAKEPALEGSNTIVLNVPIVDDTLEVSKAFHAALERYAPDLKQDSPQWNSSVVSMYAAGLLFEAAAKAGDLGPESTPEDVKKALYALPEDETLGGFAPPLNFEEGKPAQVKCAFVVEVEGGEMTSPNGADPICAPDDEARYAELAAAAAGG